MEAIDDKKSIYTDNPEEIKQSAFSDFELEITESDWLNTKAKLDNEKAAMAQDNIFSKGLSELELTIEPEDWPETYRKYLGRKKRRKAIFWLGTGVIALLITMSAFFGSGLLKDNTVMSVDNKTTSRTDTQIPEPPSVHTPAVDKPNTGENIAADTKSGNSESETEQQRKTGKLNNGTDATDISSSNQSDLSNRHSGIRKADINSGNAESGSSGKQNAGVLVSENTDVVNPAEPLSKQIGQTEISEADKKRSETPQIQSNTNSATETQENKSSEISTFASANTDKKEVSDTPQNPDKGKTNVTPPPPARIGLYAGIINQIAMTHRLLGSENIERYNQIRNAGEKPFMQWTGGFEIGLQKTKYQISTGLQYTNQSWSTNYKYNYMVYDSIPVIRNGQIIAYFLFRGRDTAINETNNIKISKVQIPLEYNRMFKVNDKLQLLAGAGMLMSWNTKTTGSKMLNPQNMYLYNYKALQDKERSFGIAPSVNFGIQNTIYKQLSLQTSVFANMSAFSRFTDEFKVKDHPYSIGINIKLLYQIR